MDDSLFRQDRRLTSMFKFALEMLEDIKIESDTAMEKLGESLMDYEDFCEKEGLKIELCHLINHANFLTDERLNWYRKKILDRGNALKRELQLEKGYENTTHVHGQ